MVELSCFTSLKERTRAPSSLGLEAAAQEKATVRLNRVRENPNQLYEIEVLEEEDRIKVHYTGYSSRYDEWLRRSEIVFKPPKQHAHEPDFSLLSVLACSIKKSLTVSRKADSAVRIQLPFDMTEFQRLVEKGKSLGNSRYGLQSYSDINELLGDKWHLRIININGDFSYVILETVSFYLIRPKPIIEFDVENSGDSTNLRFTPVYIEQGYSLVFKFVRGNGNSKKLSKFL